VSEIHTIINTGGTAVTRLPLMQRIRESAMGVLAAGQKRKFDFNKLFAKFTDHSPSKVRQALIIQ